MPGDTKGINLTRPTLLSDWGCLQSLLGQAAVNPSKTPHGLGWIWTRLAVLGGAGMLWCGSSPKDWSCWEGGITGMGLGVAGSERPQFGSVPVGLTG